MPARFIVADVFDGLATLETGSVDLVVTSPPFLALRSYLPADHELKGKEIGSEVTPAEFIDTLLKVTAELRRVLAPHGSICVELGDTYAGSSMDGGDQQRIANGETVQKSAWSGTQPIQKRGESIPGPRVKEGWPLAKSRTLIPSLYQIALAYGFNPLTGQPSPAGQWRIRNIVTWARPNPPVGALGDKWRPATSDLIVACTSGKRYWDDLSTRKPYTELTMRVHGKTLRGELGGLNGPKADAATDANRPFERQALTHSGAPLLDYWVIPPGGYAGAHYAVFPEELVVPCVQAMCPQRVCKTCGEPSRRIVETSYEAHGDPARHNAEPKARADYALQQRTENAQGMANGRASRIDSTLGWSDCGHGSIVCSHCSALVPYDYAIRRPRETTPVRGGVGQEALLGESVEVENGQEEASGDLRGLRGGVLGSDRDIEDLQPVLFGEAGAHGGADEHTPTPPQLDWTSGAPRQIRGDLHSGVGAEGLSGSAKERMDDGASGSDAGSFGQTAGTVGVGPPSERDQDGQPDRELGDRDSRSTVGDRDLPELPTPVRDSLTGYVCGCGSIDFKYVADHWRPGLVLDPFAGSGTTLAVATGHGRDAIGIDIDSRNADLARDRVGPFFFEMVDLPVPTP